MTAVRLPPYIFVGTENEWQACMAEISGCKSLAMDLESNSLFAYQEQVCLIQISTPRVDYIVDPIAGLDLAPLGRIVQDPSIEKVFHAAEYDCILMRRQYGWKLENLFDTMWAARILGYERYGLANLLESAYGVKLNKKFQKANWCKRPLTNNQLIYAQMDTHFLLRLRDDLAMELEQKDRLLEARESFAEQSRVNPSDKNFDPDGFWSINGTRGLSPSQQAVVKALYQYRDQQARRQDRPHFKIFGDRTLVEIAQVLPRHTSDLEGLHGMSNNQIKRYGRSLLRLVREAQDDPAPVKPKRKSNRPPEAVVDRYERLHLWRKERAHARGVESDVIMSRDALWELARRNPGCESDLVDIRGLGPWRRQTYGKDILRVLADGR